MTGPEQGPSGAEAAQRLAVYGPTEPTPVRRLSAVVQLLRLLANPLVIILLVAPAAHVKRTRHVMAPEVRAYRDEALEQRVADLFRRAGWKVRRQPSAGGNLRADLLARRGEHSYVVEVKERT